MLNLYGLVTGAHGGQALDSLAQQFGLSRGQADSAVQALLPALSAAFTAKAAQPGGLGDIAGAMTDDHHKQAYADPNTAQDPATQQKGGDVVGNIFGNNAIVGQVLGQASRYTGIPQATLEGMLPVVTSLVVGGASTALHNQGLGGMLGQLSQGGLGGMLGQFGGTMGGAGAAGSEAGGFAGMLGNIFNSFVGGGSSGSTNGQPTAAGGAQLPPMVQAGLDSLFRMFQPGVPGQTGAPGQAAGPGGPDRQR